MMNYKFTQDWFSSDDLQFLTKNTDEIHMLEIGSYEGKSTVWFIQNFLNNKKSTITCIDPWLNYSQDNDSINSYGSDSAEWNLNNIKDTFINNIYKTGNSSKLNFIQGYSHEILPNLISQKKKYDLIFIDGNHTAPFVLTDAVMSWQLLKKGGMIIFDDYAWNLEGEKNLRPKESIDFFVDIFSNYIEEVHTDYRKIIKRVK